MWQNILIIFIIILFSYIFTLKDKKYFDLQMLFILLSLSSIVIYKLMFLKQLKNNEHFYNANSEELTNFVENKNVNEKTDNNSMGNQSYKLNELQSQMEELTLQIDNLTKKKKEKQPNIDGTRSVSDSITNQDYELNKLEKQIENLKEQLFFTTEENQKKEYKKIKVVNSCEPLPKKEGSVTKISVSQTKVADSEVKKQDFFKMLLEKLSETGFKLNLNLV